MARIYFWSAGNDGCAYYRCAVPAEELARRGHKTHVAWTWIDEPIGKGEGWLKPDVLVGQRVTNEGPSITWRTACRDPNIYAVYELDDDLFNIDPSSEIAYKFFSQDDNRNRIIANIAMADAVVVSTPGLQEVVSKYNKTVRVVPNTVPSRYLVGRQRGPEFDIGWHGSTTHAMDWAYAERSIVGWLRRNPDKTINMIGADYGAAWRLPNYRHTKWLTPIARLWEAFSFQVGLAPLRPHKFNRSKSHVKALEYAARGIPVLATDAEPYRDFVVHGDSGFLIKQDHEWSKYLQMLVYEPSHAELLGRNALKQAQLYTTERWGDDWCRAYGVSTAATLGV